jgi:hypothetical protein
MFPAKACPALSKGWRFADKNMRQIMNLEHWITARIALSLRERRWRTYRLGKGSITLCRKAS